MAKDVAVFKSKVNGPKLGECFEIKPAKIRRDLFQKERNNPEEEKLRLWILEAFFEMDKNPEKYERNFFTLIPERRAGHQSVEDVLGYASKIGGEVTDWVEQGLEFAQRIDNGEEWGNICRRPADIKQVHVIIWKNGMPRFLAGSNGSAAEIVKVNLTENHTLYDTVPKVTLH